MAMAEKTENKTKVLVNVYEPVIAIMKHKLDAACLKRDAYLDKALHIEAGFLREEVTTPNSDKAKSYIADNLKQIKLKQLNLLLSTETVELINEVCKEKNIPRDAFINRVFLLLIASDNVLMALFGHNVNTKDYLESGLDGFVHDDFIDRPNILDSVEEFVSISPFFRLRLLICDNLKLYSYAFKKNYLSMLPDEYAFLKTDNTLGFNTLMSDEEVLEQEALDKSINSNVQLDKLLAFAKKEKQARPAKTKTVGEAQ